MELAKEDRITDTSFNDEFIISDDKEPLKPTERRAPSDQLIYGGDKSINGKRDKRIASDQKIQQAQIKRDSQMYQRSPSGSKEGENNRVISAGKGVVVYQESVNLKRVQDGVIDPETRTAKKPSFRIHFSTGKKTQKDRGIESEYAALQAHLENQQNPVTFNNQQQGSPQRQQIISRPFSVECCRKPSKNLRQSPPIKVSKGNRSFVLSQNENKLRQTSYPFQSAQQNVAFKLLNNCLERQEREGSKSAEQRCRSTLSFSPGMSKQQKVPEFRTQALVDLRKQVNEARGVLEFEKKRTSEIMSMLSSMRQRVFGKIDKNIISNSKSEHEAEINFIESRIRTVKKRMKKTRKEDQDKDEDEEAEKEQQERFQALVELQRALQTSKKELNRLQRENKVLKEERDTYEEQAKDESRLAQLKEMEVNRLRADLQQLNGNQLQYMSLKLEVQKKKKELDLKLAEFDKIRQENISLKLHAGQSSSASKSQQQQQQGGQSIQQINDSKLTEITNERDRLIKENERLKSENEFFQRNNNNSSQIKQGKNEFMNLQTNAQDKRMNVTDKEFYEQRRGRDNSFSNGQPQNRFEVENVRNSNQNSSYQNTNQFYESQQDQQNRFNDSINQQQGQYYQQLEQSQQNQEQNSQLFKPTNQEQQQNKPQQLNYQQWKQPQYDQRSDNKPQRSPPKDQMKRLNTEELMKQQEEYKYVIDELNAKVKDLQKGNAGEIQRLRNEYGNLQKENERQRVFFEQQIDDLKYQMTQETRQSQSNFANHGVQRGFSEGRRARKEW